MADATEGAEAAAVDAALHDAAALPPLPPTVITADAWRRVLNPMEEFAARIQSPDFKPKADTLNYVRGVLDLLPAIEGADLELRDAVQRIGDVVNTVTPAGLAHISVVAAAAEGLGEVVNRFGARRRFFEAFSN